MAAAALLAVLVMLGDTVGALADVGIYHRYATHIVDGQLPYRNLPIEYPPLAIPLFVLPRLVTQGHIPCAILRLSDVARERHAV